MERQKRKDAGFIRKTGTPPAKLKLRNGLNIAFIIVVTVTIVLYFALPAAVHTPYYIGSGLLAVVLKAIETAVRANEQKKQRT